MTGIWFGARRRLGKTLAAADRARSAGDWPGAARLYGAVVAADPVRADIWIQYGHALKEAGDRPGARRAYVTATEIAPEAVDGWLQLGHACKADDAREAAIAAFATAATLDPGLAQPRDELEILGAHDRLPGVYHSLARRQSGIESVVSALATTRRAIDSFSRTSSFPAGRHDDFRHAYPIERAPASHGEQTALTIIVRAIGAAPWQLLATLQALAGQHRSDWHAIVIADADIRDHPVAGLAVSDRRVRFADVDDWSAGPGLLLEAGTVPDPEALGWFAFVSARTGCAAAYCDDDHVRRHWEGSERYSGPVYRQPFAQAIEEQGGALLPGLFLADVAGAAEWMAGHESLDMLVRGQTGNGGIVHIPRLLLSRLDLPEPAQCAPLDRTVHAPIMTSMQARRIGITRLAVVIPTKDGADILRQCIETLHATAAQPDRLRFVVVDNRSTDPAMTALFRRLERTIDLRVISMDAPFNWSLANNLGVAALDGDEHLVFANNDVEARTQNWDDRVREHLADPRIGVVGARLLYPDGSLQHVGIVLGMNGGMPMHEGSGRPGADGGPSDRWKTVRSCAAVTGAFMAMRRAVFNDVGGFDVRDLPLAYNDIDMCLRVRAGNLLVRYAADIELVHHESKTRGMNVTQSQVAWDEAELRAFHARWGEGMRIDPAYNLHWNRRGRPFEAYREPNLREILTWIDASALPSPWTVALPRITGEL